MEKMTGKKRDKEFITAPASLGMSSVSFELKKNAREAVAIIGGIVSINGYNREELELLSHSGRIRISGERLTLSVLEGRTLEVRGRVKEVTFSYGKN